MPARKKTAKETQRARKRKDPAPKRGEDASPCADGAEDLSHDELIEKIREGARRNWNLILPDNYGREREDGK